MISASPASRSTSSSEPSDTQDDFLQCSPVASPSASASTELARADAHGEM
uniref:Uncharacterized protein n=1 Tax=Arundo donax TaxID=35708 RepID=A0A0A9EI26_ARUDO